MEKVRRIQEGMPPYPTGYSWKEFVASLGKGVKPFALTVERQVQWNEYFGHTAPRETFFGVLCSRKDRKLGALCFGQATKEFGGEETRASSPKFLSVEALDPKFLRTSSFEKDEEPNFLSTMDHKVVAIVFEEEAIDELMAKCLVDFLPAENVPSAKKAAELVIIRDFLDLFFHTFCPTPLWWDTFPKTAEVMKRLVGCLDTRRKFLQVRNRKFRALIQANDEEISAL